MSVFGIFHSRWKGLGIKSYMKYYFVSSNTGGFIQFTASSGEIHHTFLTVPTVTQLSNYCHTLLFTITTITI